MPGATRPSPAQFLLLRAALGEGREARAAFLEWAGAVDLGGLDVQSTRLLPLLAARLDGAAVEHPWMPRLRGVHRSHWYRNQILLRRLAALLGDLSSASVPAALSMGAALAPLYYPDLGARPLLDAVIVVAPQVVVAAAQRLMAGGWAPEGLALDAFTAPQLLARDAVPFRCGAGLQVELCWRRLDRALHFPGEDDLWTDTQRVDIEGVSIAVPGPVPLLLEVCARAVDSAGGPMSWAADVAMILRRRALDWARVVELARRYELDLELAQMLGWLAEHLDETAPAAPLAELSAASRARKARRRLEQNGGELAGLARRSRRHLRAWALLRGRGGAYVGAAGAALYLKQAFALRSEAEIPRHLWRSLRRRFRRAGGWPSPRDDGARANARPRATDRGPR